MVDWFNVGTSMATVIIAAAALVALVANFWSVRQAKKTAHANTVSIFMEEYASTSMHKALMALRNFKKDDGTLLYELQRLVTIANDLDQNDVYVAQKYIDEWGDKIEPARRKVSSFYNRAWLLYDNYYLSKKAFLIIADTSGKEFLSPIVRPLTCAVHLIDLCDSDLKKYRDNPPDFNWLDKFSIETS